MTPSARGGLRATPADREAMPQTPRTRMLGAAILALFAGVFFAQGLFMGTLTLIWDAADYTYPILAYSAHVYRQWLMPLWNPFLFNGYPVFADPQAQTFYPLNLLVASISEFTPRVVYLQIVLHYVLAGVGMFLLCARLGYGMSASLVAGASYMFSGYMVGHFSHILICAAAWLPLLILFLDQALDRSSVRQAVLGGLVLGLTILSGAVQAVFYAVVVLMIHWGFKTAVAYRATRRASVLATSARLLLIILSIGILLAAVQWLPTAEFIRDTSRAETRSLASAGRGVSYPNLFTVFAPNYFGGITFPYWGSLDITQQNLYMGMAPLLLAGLVLVYRRTAWTIYASAMALLSFLVSMGTHTPVFPLIYYTVPGFGYFRDVVHFAFVFHFYVSLLAAEGASLVLRGDTTGRRLIAYGALSAAGIGALALALPRAAVPAALDNAQGALIWCGSLVLLTGIWCALSRVRVARRLLPPLLVALVFADLFVMNGAAVTLGDRKSPNRLEEEPSVTSQIKRLAGLEDHTVLHQSPPVALDAPYRKAGLFRIYVQPPNQIYRFPRDQVLLASVGFDRAALQSLFLVDGYSPVVLRRHQEFAEGVGSRSLSRFLELSNVQYALTVGQGIEAARLAKFLPRAQIVHAAETLTDPQAILARLSDPSFDPYSAVILEGTPPPSSPAGPAPSRVAVAKYLPTALALDVASDRPGYLVLNETYYPGWKASIDGHETPVYRANYEFKAVAVPAGSHRIEFWFSPRSFQIGLGVTLVTLVASAVLCMWSPGTGRAERRVAPPIPSSEGARGSRGERRRRERKGRPG
jgi:hypothetical protein